MSNGTVTRGTIIQANDFIDTVKTAVDNTIGFLANHPPSGDNFPSPSPVLDANTTQLQGIFASSKSDKAEGDRRGQSNVYLVNTRRPSLLNRIEQFAKSDFSIRPERIIMAKPTARTILSAFALASCIREAIYDLYSSSGRTLVRGFTIFNNDNEPELLDTAGNYIFAHGKDHVGLLKSKAEAVYGAANAPNYVWYNLASTDINARIPNYAGDPGSSPTITSIIGLNRAASGQINVSTLTQYGYSAPLSNVVIDGKRIRNYINDLSNLDEAHKGSNQSLYIGNIVFASTVNGLMSYLSSFNKYMASSYYCVFSNNQSFVPSLEVVYVVDAEYSKSGSTLQQSYGITKGENHTALSWKKVFGDNAVDENNHKFKNWALNWADSSHERPGQPTANVGDVIANIQGKLSLLYTTENPGPISNLSTYFSWGYCGLKGCKWYSSKNEKSNIGDDYTEYSEEDSEQKAENLYSKATVSCAPVPQRSSLKNGYCSAYIRWKGDPQFGSSNGYVSEGIVQRWATITIDLSKNSPGAEKYKYFYLTELSNAYNENAPTHYNTWVYMVDLMRVKCSDLNKIVTLSNYMEKDWGKGKWGDEPHEKGFNYYKGNTWKNGGTAPFWRRGGSRSEAWICPFAITRRFHVYPIIGYFLASYGGLVNGKHVTHEHMATMVTDVLPYHGKCGNYMAEKFMRDKTYFNAGPFSAYTRWYDNQRALRSLCTPQMTNEERMDVVTNNKRGVYVHGCESFSKSDRLKVDSENKLYTGRYGMNNHHSENMTFKINNKGQISVGIFISRSIRDGGGADQSWGAAISAKTDNTIGKIYNEDLPAWVKGDGLLKDYYEHES